MDLVYIKFYDCVNFGDDVLLNLVVNSNPSQHFLAYASSAYQGEYKNLKIISKDCFAVKVINRLLYVLTRKTVEEWIWKLCARLVYVGGSIFIEPKNGADRTYLLHWWDAFSKQGAKASVLDANFGPSYTEEWKAFFDKVLPRFKSIFWRDMQSLKCFAEQKNMQVRPDLAFAFPAHYTRKTSSKAVILNVMDVHNKEFSSVEAEETYFFALKNVAQYFSEREYSIKLLSLCAAEGDLKACRRLQKMCHGIQTTIVEYTGDIELVTREIEEAAFVLASRFHAAVFAIKSRVPCEVWAYSRKTVNMISDLGFPIPYKILNELREDSMVDIEKANSALVSENSITNIAKAAAEMLEMV